MATPNFWHYSTIKVFILLNSSSTQPTGRYVNKTESQIVDSFGRDFPVSPPTKKQNVLEFIFVTIFICAPLKNIHNR